MGREAQSKSSSPQLTFSLTKTRHPLVSPLTSRPEPRLAARIPPAQGEACPRPRGQGRGARDPAGDGQLREHRGDIADAQDGGRAELLPRHTLHRHLRQQHTESQLLRHIISEQRLPTCCWWQQVCGGGGRGDGRLQHRVGLRSALQAGNCILSNSAPGR